MSTLKAAIAVLAIFILGTIFGLAVSLWIMPNMSVYAQPAREILSQRFGQRLGRNLSLSPEQKRAIAGIVDDTKNELAQIRQETRPRVRQTILNARERIRAHLTPEQRTRFDEMFRRNRRLINILSP